MRTTLTLDPDVAVMLETYRKRNELGLKEAVNKALRKGLQATQSPPSKRTPFSTRVVDHGQPIAPNIDDIGELIQFLDEDTSR